jgi:hypothetical protein
MRLVTINRYNESPCDVGSVQGHGTTKGVFAMQKQCSIPACDKPTLSKGWCSKHYWRWTRRGDPNVIIRIPNLSLEQRFLQYVHKSEDCWIWTGHKNPQGYGRINVGGKLMMATHISWEIFNGKIPERLYVLHHCDNPPCVRPDHLFLGTKKDNAQDALSKGRLKFQPRKTRCVNGHPFEEKNTWSYKGKRYCRECRRHRVREYCRKRRARR